MAFDALDSNLVMQTLERRVGERFPDFGLHRVSRELLGVARKTEGRIAALKRPRWGLRVLIGIVSVAIVAIALGGGICLSTQQAPHELASWVQAAESVLNEIVLGGLAMLFLWSLERRSTPSSPERHLSRAELRRYLDYCSELLSLTSKLAALYAQSVDDPVVLDAVNGIQTLTTGLSAKVWQKIALIRWRK